MKSNDSEIDASIELIAAADLEGTWRTLMAVVRNYAFDSPGAATLIEARRLIEVEMRAQHGDEAWSALRD